MRILPLIFGALAFAVPACKAAVTIRGTVSCGDWVTERTKHGVGAFGNEAWLVGYLSGIATVTNTNFLKGTDNASLFLWMDTYCRSSPLKDIDDGGSELYIELSKKVRQ